MVEVLPVIEGIYQMRSGLERPGRYLYSYLVLGGKRALIDPGPTTLARGVLEEMRNLGQAPEALRYIMATHIHVDHAGGLGYLARELPDVKIVVHQAGLRHLLDPTRLIESTAQAFGANFEEHFGPILPVPEAQTMVVQGGESIDLGGIELRIIYTPGHAPHHISLFEPRTRTLFCGEALGTPHDGGAFVMPSAAPPLFDPEIALESIERLRALNPAILCYAHFGMAQDVRLIGSVQETIKAFREILSQAVQEGVTREEMIRRLKGYCQGDAMAPQDDSAYAMTIPGFLGYFRRRGETA